MTCVKVTYKSRKLAEDAAYTAARVTWVLLHKRDKVLRAYECPKCRRWHLTSNGATIFKEPAA